MIQNDLSGHSDCLPLVLLRVRKLRGAGRWNKSREGVIRIFTTHVQENVPFPGLMEVVHSTPYRDSFVVVFLFAVAYDIRLLYATMAYVKNRFYAKVFLVYKLFLSVCVIAYEEKTANDKIQKEREQTEAQPDGA